METIQIIVQQTMVMFLLIGVGYLLYKHDKISKEGSRDVASLLVTVVIPAVILNSFISEYTEEKVQALLMSTLFAALVLAIAVVLSRLLFPENAVDDFAAAFSNPSFFGIPLITAAFGNQAVLYITPFIVGLNILQFSYGVRLMSGRHVKIKVKEILLNPIFISAVLGILIFAFRIPVPVLIRSPLSMLANINGALAMIVLGVYLAQTDLKSLLTQKSLYKVSFVRLFVIPITTLFILQFVSANLVVKQTLLIAAACPVGANVAVYAQLNGKDYTYAVQTVIHSTLFSVLSIPGILLLAEFFG